MNGERNRIAKRQSRHARIRQRVKGTAERPRMSIMISNRHMHVQFVDDLKQATLASVSTQAGGEAGATVPKAHALGKSAGQAALAAGIRRVVVDRGGFKFHGRVKALVDGAVEAGLQIRTRPVEATVAPAEAVQEKETT